MTPFVAIFGKLLLFIAGEKYESVDDLTLPIPMERLREMANRMNQILTNLLVSVCLPVFLLLCVDISFDTLQNFVLALSGHVFV